MRHLQNHYRWIIVALTVINQAAIIGFALSSFAIFSVPWLEQYNVSVGQLMIPSVMFLVINSLLSPVIGPRLDKIPLRLPIVAGFILYAGGLGILAMANAYWQVIAVYALLFSLATILSGTFISPLLVNKWFITNKGLALGISVTGTSVGGILFPPLLATALSVYALPTIMLSMAAFTLFVLVPLNFLILRVNPPDENQQHHGQAKKSVSQRDWTTKSIIASRAFWIPMTLFIPMMLAFSAIQFNLGNYLQEAGHPAAFAGQLRIGRINALFTQVQQLWTAVDSFDTPAMQPNPADGEPATLKIYPPLSH